MDADAEGTRGAVLDIRVALRAVQTKATELGWSRGRVGSKSRCVSNPSSMFGCWFASRRAQGQGNRDPPLPLPCRGLVALQELALSSPGQETWSIHPLAEFLDLILFGMTVLVANNRLGLVLANPPK